MVILQLSPPTAFHTLLMISLQIKVAKVKCRVAALNTSRFLGSAESVRSPTESMP